MGSVVRDHRSGRLIWAIRYRDVDGRTRKERTDASSMAIARRLLSERENAVEKARLLDLPGVADLINPSPAPTLRNFARTEYLPHVRAHCSDETARRYENLFNINVLPKLGEIPLSQVNPGRLQRYSDFRLQAGAKPAAVRHELMALSGLFREAVKREILRVNPVKLVSKPRVENMIVRFLSREEEARLLSFAREPLRSAILVAIHSGMREGEQLNLTWNDVVFKETAEGSYLVVRQTKTKRDRVVPMSGTLYRTLRGLTPSVLSPYVFTNPETGTRFQRFNADGWREALKRAGITGLRWHDLRHTFGSRLAQAGESLIAIKELLGHQAVAVTMRYAHLSPSNLRGAVKALDRDEDEQKSAHRSAHAEEAQRVAVGAESVRPSRPRISEPSREWRNGRRRGLKMRKQIP